MLFHQDKVCLHLRYRSIIACVGIAVVAIHALEFYSLTVYLEHAVLHGYFPEAYLFAYGLLACKYSQVIKIWLFSRPQLWGLYVDNSFFTVSRTEICYSVSVPVGKGRRNVTAKGGKFKLCGSIIGENGFRDVVFKPNFWSGQYINITENSRKSYLVLIFKISAVAPFQHRCGYFVFALTEQWSNIKFRGAVGHLGIACKFAVYVQIYAAVYALENKYPVVSVGGIVIAPLIDAHGDIIGHIRRVIGDRVADVCVLGLVIAVKLPV